MTQSLRSRAGAQHQPAKARFLIVGVWNTIFGILAFIVADATVGRITGYVASLTLMFAVAIPQAHAAQRRFVWRSHGRYLPELIRFSWVFLVAYVVNLIFLGFAVEFLDASTVPAQVLISGGIAVSTYLIHRTWTFRPPRPANGSRPGPRLGEPVITVAQDGG